MLEPNITRGQIAIDPRNGVLFYKDGSGNLMKTTLSFNQDTYTDVSTDDAVTFSSNVIIDGNLTVNGDTVTVNAAQLYVEDNIIILNSNIAESATPTLDAGIEINRGNLPNVSIRWNETLNRWEYTNDGSDYNAIGSGGGGGGSVEFLNDVGDVANGSAVSGEYLKFDGTYWVNASIQLGTNTSGNYVQNLVAGTGVTLSNNSGEGSQPTIAIGQDVSTGATPTFGRVIAPLTGNVSGNLTGNVTGNLTGNVTGDVTGTVSSISNHGINDLSDVVISGQANGDFLRYQSGNWVNDAVNLATDTIGNYVQNLVAGTGVTVTNNSGEGSTPTIGIGQSVGTTDTVTFNVVNADLTGDVTGTVSDISNHTMNDLSDVTISDPANGDFLRYQSGNWINDPVNLSTDTVGDYVKSLVSGNGITITNNSGEGATPNISFSGSINDLSDLTITSAQNGQILEYDGTAWVNTVRPSSEPIGHENKADSVISFDESSRQFSIAPLSTSYTVWCAGKRYVKTTTESVTIPDTSGLYYIYFNSSGSLAYKTTFFTWDQDTPTAYVYWNENDNKAYFFADERHGVTLDWATHEYLHRTRGAAIANGFGANNYILNGNGSLDAHAKMDIADGTFFDEDLQVDITHSATPTPNTWEQVLQGNAEIPVFYRLNNHWKKDAATEFPLKQGISRPQYNLNTAGEWSTTDVQNNHFGVSWIIATNNLNEPVIAVLGQGSYTDNGSAQAEFYASLNLDGFPIVEFRPLYKIIYECRDSYTNAPSAQITDVIDLRSVISSEQGVAATAISDHGSMTGLEDDDHTQYLNTTRHDAHDHSTAMSTVVLDDIGDVQAATPSNNQVLTWNTAESKWIAQTLSVPTALDDITDVSLSSATPDQVLSWNGSAWVNATVGLYWNKVNGNDNASFGTGVLPNATSDSYYNIGIGYEALNLLTSGDGNIAIGFTALSKVTEGEDNVAIGTQALKNSISSYNVAIGRQSLWAHNGAVGSNIAIGYQTLFLDTTGYHNTAVGIQALRANTTGNSNVAIGYSSLYSNTTAGSNIAIGSTSMYANTTGEYNVAIGGIALRQNTTANRNVAIGYGAALSITTGHSNVAIGHQALYNNVTGLSNVAIGYEAGGNETGSNKLYIANSSTSNPLIYGDFSTSLLRVNGALEITSSLSLTGSNGIIFEGATPNDYETTLSVVEPTADRTILLPNASTTLVGTDTTDTLTNKTISNAGPISILQSANNSSYPLTITSANEQGGGVGYVDILKLTNSKSGATNINKHIRLSANGNLEIINSAYTATIFSLGDDGAITAVSTVNGATLNDTGWTTVSSFTNSFSSVATVAYRKINNVVYLRGNLQGGTANTGAFVLPSGYRPIADAVFPSQQYGTSSINYVTIGSDGVVLMNATSGWLTSVVFPVA